MTESSDNKKEPQQSVVFNDISFTSSVDVKNVKHLKSMDREYNPLNVKPEISKQVPSLTNTKYIAKNVMQSKKENKNPSIFKNKEKINIGDGNRKSLHDFFTAELCKINKIIFDFFMKLLLSIVYCVFAIFRYFQYNYNCMKLRFYSLLYNPSDSPQLIRTDVSHLSKIPKRLAAILEYKSEEEVGGGVLGLMEDAGDLVAWSLSAGIKHLTLYDYDGLLKDDVDLLRKIIFSKLCKYFGAQKTPKFAVRIPHKNQVYFNIPITTDATESDSLNKKVSIEIVLLSVVDGRETIVELTKTLAELYKEDKISEDDITMDLVDTELKQLVGEEPDLLLYFGPNLDLQGYPPWHIRLTELFWEHDNNSVSYTVFIRGLKQFSASKVNVGK
ncbi:ditrans,polycis-polyprenyl diphosphate synthase [Hanseniaspora uvarum]|nr:ditrans,polycis-polyprenyl diphosphate synthase [Hanseniaspora uvarum]